jgi:hypothetical protein
MCRGAKVACKQRELVPMQCVTTATGRDTTRQIVGVLEAERKAKGQRENCVEVQRLKNRWQVSITAVPQVQKDFAFASVDATPEKSRCAIIDSGTTSHFCLE